MKKKLIILALFCAATNAQQYEAPKQLSSCLRSDVRTNQCLKLIADPCCVPTAMVACLTYNVCNLPYPYACAAGAGATCTCIACATEADENTSNYYSVNAFAVLKRGILTVFPCMETRFSGKNKTE